MTSIIKVNTFQDTNGNALFNSDGSGNVTLSAGAMKNTVQLFLLTYKQSNNRQYTNSLIAFDKLNIDHRLCFYILLANYAFTVPYW